MHDAVMKNSVRCADVFHRREGRVSGGDAQHLEHPYLPGLHPGGETGKRRIETTIESNEQRQVGALGQVEAGINLVEITAQRFFRENRFAGLERVLDLPEMLMRRRGNDHGIDVRLAKRPVSVRCVVTLQFGGQALGLGFIHIHHALQPQARYRLYALDVKLPRPPKAKQHHVFSIN